MSITSPYAALKIRDYRYFISARFCITLAIQIQAVVVSWQVYEITKDPLSLGLIGLAEAIPSIGVSLYAGHVADVVQRKKIILLCVGTLLLCSLCLLFFTLEPGQFFISYGVIPIYTIIFISGIARGFITPALFAFMPQLVPRELYSNAITWNSTLWETASLSGPPLGGLLYGFFGISVAYTTDVLLVLSGLLLAFAVSNKPLPPSTSDEGMVEKIKEGLRFVYNNKIVLSAISLDLFAVLFGGAVALLPIFADTILHVGKVGLGFLRAAPGVGALLMALYLVHHPIKKNAGKLLFYCVGGFGVCMILFGLSTSFWISMFLLMMSGVFDCVSVIIRSTLLQTLTPENMKGRVSAVNHIFIGSSNEIGMFESGVTARLFGVVRSVIIGGCLTLTVVGVTSWFSKSLRRLQRVE
ncbi:MFS transporter [Ohtaekwangia koreensis]|uniref:Predicted arabinose efflux permease, MFS family n=1 Tax=Ohtaekwangia koreensis TaxID=688867 RepID=A0A1T5L8H9_9BACT|nr:MFS transporter [Ohtaekwangia koreensis]SKC71949.1 Predicted arabinose efflux permease, MFS family [Ohtaekwangia koreensis]